MPGYRPVRRTHRKALCRQPKRPERSSILAPTTAPGERDGTKFDPFVELDRESEGILGVTAMRATPGPRLAARRRARPATNERNLQWPGPVGERHMSPCGTRWMHERGRCDDHRPMRELRSS